MADVASEVEGRATQSDSGDARSGLAGELNSLLKTATLESDSASMRGATVKGGRVADEEEVVRILFHQMKEEAAAMEAERRECPVPKPGGKIGELLGFGRDGRNGRRRRTQDER